MGEDRGRERAPGVAGAGMHDHARGLVHHEHGVVFVDDLERQRLGAELLRLGRRDLRLDPLARPHPVRGLARAAAHGDAAALDQGLEPGPGELGQAGGEPAIEPLTGVSHADDHWRRAGGRGGRPRR